MRWHSNVVTVMLGNADSRQSRVGVPSDRWASDRWVQVLVASTRTTEVATLPVIQVAIDSVRIELSGSESRSERTYDPRARGDKAVAVRAVRGVRSAEHGRRAIHCKEHNGLASHHLSGT
jgi:hypothetical protein